jgi:hypothetical protein
MVVPATRDWARNPAPSRVNQEFQTMGAIILEMGEVEFQL